MRIIGYLAVVAAILFLATSAFAQGLIGPSGSDYTVRFVHEGGFTPGTIEVCLYQADVTDPALPVPIGAAIACTNDVTSDGVTVNELTVTFAPPLEMDTPILVIASRTVMVAGTPTEVSSQPSNWKSLAAFLQAPTIVD